jgi:hypothetical protein
MLARIFKNSRFLWEEVILTGEGNYIASKLDFNQDEFFEIEIESNKL